MRIVALVAFSFVALGIGTAGPANAQGIYIGPGGVQVDPGRPRPDYAPPPREESRRDEIRERMFALRAECEDGERRACVRLGIIIGEHREHRSAWRREHPDLFWWER
jgi:hypothetical protein